MVPLLALWVAATAVAVAFLNMRGSSQRFAFARGAVVVGACALAVVGWLLTHLSLTFDAPNDLAGIGALVLNAVYLLGMLRLIESREHPIVAELFVGPEVIGRDEKGRPELGVVVRLLNHSENLGGLTNWTVKIVSADKKVSTVDDHPRGHGTLAQMYTMSLTPEDTEDTSGLAQRCQVPRSPLGF